jgi:hypothetical protein
MPICVKGKGHKIPARYARSRHVARFRSCCRCRSDHFGGEFGEHSSATGRNRSDASFMKASGEQQFFQRDLGEVLVLLDSLTDAHRDD